MPKPVRICKAPECQNAATKRRDYCSDGCQLWPRVDRSGGPDACWIWRGHVNPQNRYGQVTGSETAHRRAYRLHYGDPGDMCVLHECDVKLCVNPRHLSLGTKKANWIDSVNKGRQTVIARGEANHLSKLQPADVLTIRNEPERVSVLARRYGVGRSTIHKIRSRETWQHIPDIQIDGDPGAWVFVSGVMDRPTPTTNQQEA